LFSCVVVAAGDGAVAEFLLEGRMVTIGLAPRALDWSSRVIDSLLAGAPGVNDDDDDDDSDVDELSIRALGRGALASMSTEAKGDSTVCQMVSPGTGVVKLAECLAAAVGLSTALHAVSGVTGPEPLESGLL